MKDTREYQRLVAHRERRANWRHWGPYLSERAWGTVREDYSAGGEAWDYLPHDHARSRAYRWNEDGLAGISDRNQYLCFSLALWNQRDAILKERLFGLTGSEGNHGEDVKELYYYLDSTPTHSYMKMLYKYPQAAFPYGPLVSENQRRGFHDFEYELMDTGVFHENRYFDVFVEYAKADQDDLVILVRAVNRGPESASLTLLPQIWYRNTWSWGYDAGPMGDVPGKPELHSINGGADYKAIKGTHPALGTMYFYAEHAAETFFTENETNYQRLYGTENATPYVKDAFHRAIIQGQMSAVNPHRHGTKAVAIRGAEIPPGGELHMRLRLSDQPKDAPFADFDAIFQQRRDEADDFYAAVQKASLNEDERRIQRQAYAGMLWTKQLYYYDVEQWLKGDPGQPDPPEGRQQGRNADWAHLNNFDVISMPDKWEYPWYATWDLAFHTLPLAMIDPDYAKRQLELMTREWYMHPNGALPAYEWAFGDVNPPVHAWAAYRVYKIDERITGQADHAWLAGIFMKLSLNFTWWVNRKDADGNNIFQGGFLGLDNISVFDRSAALPTGGKINQSDGTAWMGFFATSMLNIALELARTEPIYQDMATKFYEHFLQIATAMTSAGHGGLSLWDAEDEFFYDVLQLPDGEVIPLRVRSLVGLMPMIAVETMGSQTLTQMPDFYRRMRWFIENRPHLSGNIASTLAESGSGNHYIISFVTRERLISVLRYLLDENEFLSPYGIRSLSKIHEAHPFSVSFGGETFSINYQPAESTSGLFGGNSNWRGPIWFPINYLMIESLRIYHRYYGDACMVEMPTGSGQWMNLAQVADELSRRMLRMFTRNEEGERPIFGGQRQMQDDPHWRDYLLFHEYFHGDNGAGLGASHQTGWTGLIADLIERIGGD